MKVNDASQDDVMVAKFHGLREDWAERLQPSQNAKSTTTPKRGFGLRGEAKDELRPNTKMSRPLLNRAQLSVRRLRSRLGSHTKMLLDTDRSPSKFALQNMTMRQLIAYCFSRKRQILSAVATTDLPQSLSLPP